MNVFIYTYRMLFSITLVFSMTTLTQAASVHISGKVQDVNTAIEMSDVKIYISDLTDGSIDSAFTNASGMWEYDFEVTSIAEDDQLPKRFYVSQNYPNPFNPSTKIDIIVPAAGEVSLTVYNILGAVVDSYQEYLTPGGYSIDWHARGSAGIYFLNIKNRNASIIRKMTLLDGGYGKGFSRFHSSSLEASSGGTLAKTFTTNPIKIQTSKFGYIDSVLHTEVSGGEYFEFKIETIHSASILADLHNDLLEKMIESPSYHLADYHTYNHTDIPRLQSGGVDVQLFVVWVSPSSHLQDSYNYATAMINIFENEMALNPLTIGQARTKAEALALIDENKIAAVLCVEGGHAIENDITKLKTLYQKGMRYLTITWNNSLDWAVSAQDSRSATVGLSEFGRKVIRTLDTLGVMIDVSHVGIKTIEDILAVTKNPIIASHSGVRSIRNHCRNLYDNQILAIASSGGVIGIVFYPPFLTSSGTAYIDDVADHIDYIVNLAGVDYVGLGSDFDGIGTNTVQGLDDVTKFPDLTLELLRRGYSQADVEKILGGNFMRVFEQVCGE